MEAVAVLGGAGVRRNLAGLVPVAYSPPLPFGPAYAGLAGEELLWGCDGGRGAARGGAGWVSGGPRLATSRGGAAGSVGPAGGSPHWPLAAVSKAIFPVTLLPLALGAVAAGVWLGGAVRLRAAQWWRRPRRRHLPFVSGETLLGRLRTIIAGWESCSRRGTKT